MISIASWQVRSCWDRASAGGQFKRDGWGPMLPTIVILTIAASGGLLLWFGWYGFNPGSTLSAMDFEGIGRVAANTTLAACAAASHGRWLHAYIVEQKAGCEFYGERVSGRLLGGLLHVSLLLGEVRRATS